MSQSVWDGGTEPVGADPIDLQLSRGATGSGQTSTTPATRLIDTKSVLQVTTYHGDKATEMVEGENTCRHVPRQNCDQLKNRNPHTMPAYLASTTSAVDGVGPSLPTPERASRRDNDKARAAAREDGSI